MAPRGVYETRVGEVTTFGVGDVKGFLPNSPPDLGLRTSMTNVATGQGQKSLDQAIFSNPIDSPIIEQDVNTYCTAWISRRDGRNGNCANGGFDADAFDALDEASVGLTAVEEIWSFCEAGQSNGSEI